MIQENELKKRIQEEFSKTTPYSGKYWNEVRVLIIKDDEVKVSYAFMRHCQPYDKEIWIMKPLFETKYAIFVNSETGERLFTKADTENNSSFFFSGLEESDIDTLVQLYKDHNIAPVQEWPHTDYRIFWNGNRKTLALSLKEKENGWEVKWIH